MTGLIRMMFVVFCFLGLFASDLFAISSQGGPKIGDVPPPLTLTKTLQGPPTVELSWNKLKGNVVVLEFWATWCGPCVRSIPHLNDLAEQFKNKRVIFISVTSENEGVVRLFLHNHPIKTFVALDDYQVLNKAFRVQGIPHVVIVTADGHIAAITHPSSLKPENLDEVLAGKKCSLPETEVYTVNKFAPQVVPNEAPALYEITIREHQMPKQFRGPICMWSTDTNGFEGKIATVESALRAVFDKSASRMVIDCKLPEGYFDFKLRAPPERSKELPNGFTDALLTTFHLKARRFTKEMPIYILTQINTNAPGLKRVETPGGGGGMRGGFRSTGTQIKGVADDLEAVLGKPVFDKTGLEGFYAVDMKWKLSEGEKLRIATDQRVWKAIAADPNGDWISTLPKELREGQALENNQRLKTELAKPEAQRFQPDPDAVIAAARERLGLKLTLIQGPVEILEVSEASQQ